MFRSLLVPLDGTPEAAAALPLARGIAEATAGSITLLHVVSPPSTRARQEAAQDLQVVADELRQAGLHAEPVVRAGEPASEIVREARAWPAPCCVRVIVRC